VRVNPDGHVEHRAESAHDHVDLPGHGAAVGVAQHDGVRPARDRRPQRGEGVVGVRVIAVEKMLRVVNHPPPVTAQIGHALLDQPQIVVQIRAQHFGDVPRPALAEQGGHRGFAGQQFAQVAVFSGVSDGRQVLPNAAIWACFRFSPRTAWKYSISLGLDPGQPPSIRCMPKVVEQFGDTQLVVHGQADALALRSVAQGRVI
jgi:hypothetical protein